MLALFLLQLSAGCALVIAASDLRPIAWRYLRLMAVVCLVMQALAAALVSAAGSPADLTTTRAGGAFISISILASLAWLILAGRATPGGSRLQRGVAAVAGLSALAAASAAGAALRTLSLSAGRTPATAAAIPGPLVVGTALGALLMGAATAAMLLGHRYLTETGMTIAPLKRMTRLLALGVLLRAAWTGFVVAQRWPLPFSGLSAVHAWLALCIHVTVGLLGAGVLTWMIWDCVRRRSTQSATGILYIAMVFVFLGELSSQFLRETSGLLL